MQVEQQPTLSDEELTYFARIGCGGDNVRWSFSEAGLRRTLASFAAAILSRASSAGTAPAPWQPIETAPKGRTVLVGYMNRAGKWRTVRGHYYLPQTLELSENYNGDSDDDWAPEGWYEEVENSETINFTDETPTHWMPLPPAPVSAVVPTPLMQGEPVAPDWKAVYEAEAAKFQQETLRTSELSQMLRRWVARHEAEHEPGGWSRGCEVCALVGDSRRLLDKPINAAASASPGAPSAPTAPGPLLTFSLAYIDGVMEGEPEEIRRHWARVRLAALSTAPEAPKETT